MTRVSTGRSELDVSDHGSGEPVLFIHGSIVGGTFDAMTVQPPLAERFRLISYYRQGFAGSSHSAGPYSIEEQAADALAVLRHFDIERAHIAGHSYGGVIALQLALDAPDVVQSLTLLEPALLMVPSGEAFFGRLGPAIAAYSAGDRRTAMETFTNAVGGDADYRALMDPVLGQGWFDQAVADADTLFAVEFPAVQGWAFGPDQAARIDQPVLAVVGGESLTLFNEGFDLLKDWFPGAEGYVLPGANHFLQVVNPGDMATALAAFLGRHPIAA